MAAAAIFDPDIQPGPSCQDFDEVVARDLRMLMEEGRKVGNAHNRLQDRRDDANGLMHV